MKLSVIAFTSRGLRLAERLPGLLSADGIQVKLCACFGGTSVSAAEWTRQAFSDSDAPVSYTHLTLPTKRIV